MTAHYMTSITLQTRPADKEPDVLIGNEYTINNHE